MIDDELVADLWRSFGAALDHDDAGKARRELLSAGWLDALDHDEAIAVAVVFRLQGATRHDAGALDDVVARRLGDRWQTAAGEIAVAYPVAEAAPEGTGVTHVVLPGHRDARRILWAPDLGGEHVQLIDLDADLGDQVVVGVDGEFGMVGLRERPVGTSVPVAQRGSNEWWVEALAAGRVALAHQLVAGAQTLLEMATTYAGMRRQFGQPIGTFQAVKHRLADTFVAVASADAATVAAASTGNPTAAAVAKVLAGRAASVAGRNCLQVLGGIGVTMEHDFHRYFRRSLVLDRLLGDQRSLERELGKQLRRGRLDGERLVELDDLARVGLLAPTSTGGHR